MIDIIILATALTVAAVLWLIGQPTWETYAPDWLVEAAERERPDQPWLAVALAGCTRARWESRSYIHFVAPDHPNQPGSEWQFESNLVLEETTHGAVILDILRDGRIGGIEFLSRLLDHRTSGTRDAQH